MLQEKPKLKYTILSIGTSSQRSRRSEFGQSTGNEFSGHYKHQYFGRSGRQAMMLVATINNIIFSLPSTFLIEGVDAKTYFAKVNRSAQ